MPLVKKTTQHIFDSPCQSHLLFSDSLPCVWQITFPLTYSVGYSCSTYFQCWTLILPEPEHSDRSLCEILDTKFVQARMVRKIRQLQELVSLSPVATGALLRTSAALHAFKLRCCQKTGKVFFQFFWNQNNTNGWMPNDPLIFRFFITVSLLFGINVEFLKLQNLTHSASQIICVL